MLRFIYTFILTFCLLSPLWAGGDRYASGSALANGKWVKIQVDKTGIYKLSFAELRKMGFSDPSKVSVHGYGGWALEEYFQKPYIDDVPAVSVWKGADYLLFYGKGPIKWEYDTNDETFVHSNNPYSMYGYYFVTDATETKEMQSVASASGATLQVTTFDDYALHEVDAVSVNESGRQLFGESFVSTTSRDFPFQIPGITSDAGKVSMNFIAKALTGPTAVTLKADGEQLINATIPSSGASDSYTQAIDAYRVANWTGDKKENIKINVTYGKSGHKNVHLDYIRLQMKRTLKPYGGYTFFRSLVSVLGNASRFVIQGANAQTLVFDVTDGVTPKLMETSLNGSELSFSIPTGNILREFALVQTDQTLPVPVTIGTVASQNLHALPQTDMIIIAPPAFTRQAERLAEEHRTRDGLTVAVVAPGDIYNEFSSGTPDATAYRRLMKMFYDRSTSSKDAPKYLLLFGDGAFDNRQLTSGWKKISMDNMLLTYQSEESLGMFSYVTDDYFGFLDDTEGRYPSSDKVDIGIGRFPVRTLAEAEQAVDKVIAYMDNKQMGAWKNNVCFVGDDGNNADSFTTLHMDQANQLADYVNSSHPEFNVNKLLFDAYKKDRTSGNPTFPDVRASLQKQLKNGLLYLNYTGHGSTRAWSDEEVLTINDISQSTYPNLPLWVTATCDFTRFDAEVTSAGENVFLNKKSGGIALFTTTRVVNSGPNFRINTQLVKNLFTRRIDGRRRTLGEVIKETKVNLGSDLNKLNFILIGDPALTLAYPEYNMKVTAINGQPVTDLPVTFRALEKITVTGEVLNPDGTKATGFTGLLNPTVLDSKKTVTTLDNNDTGVKFSYTDYANTMFIGNDSVRQGDFTFTFTVPKDISYSDDYGKMNLYASDEETGIEAQGAYINFIVGGTSDTGDDDVDGPDIRAAFLNDSTFISGDKVNTTPLFVASLWDQTGVNISGSSVGHDMMLTIDNSPSLSYTLNGYYESLPGKEGEGLVRFAVPTLEPGRHTAEFKVWDISNNSSSYTFDFEVVEELKPYIINLIATPNPAREQVQFRLYHNRPESKLNVTIMVYDMIGRLQWRHTESGSSELFNAYTVTWDLTNGSGARLRPGVYLYRVAVSSDYSKEASEAKKLIILAQ